MTKWYDKIKNDRMEMMGDIQKLENMVKEFCEARDWDQYHNPKDLSIGVSTEANELLDIFRFKSIDQMEQMMVTEGYREHISEELGDIFFFLLRFSQMNGFDLYQCVVDKMAKNKEKYPAEKVRGKNLKYSEY